MAVTGRPCRSLATPRQVWPTGSSRGDALFESVGSLTGSPWIYAMVALSVLLDVFLPVLPSGVLVIAAATAAAAGTGAATDAVPVPHEVPSILRSSRPRRPRPSWATWWRTGSPGAAANAWTARSPAPAASPPRRNVSARPSPEAAAPSSSWPASPPPAARWSPSAQAPPTAEPETSSLVSPGGPLLGGVQRGPRLLRSPVAGHHLAGDGGLIAGPVRRGSRSGVRDAPPADNNGGDGPLGARAPFESGARVRFSGARGTARPAPTTPHSDHDATRDAPSPQAPRATQR